MNTTTYAKTEQQENKENWQKRKIHALRRYLVKRQDKTFRRNPDRDYTRLFQEYLDYQRCA